MNLAFSLSLPQWHRCRVSGVFVVVVVVVNSNNMKSSLFADPLQKNAGLMLHADFGVKLVVS